MTTPHHPTPPALERLIDLVNTNDRQQAQDRLANPDQTQAWLTAHGLPTQALDHDQWTALLDFREGIRAAAAANNGHQLAPEAVAALGAAIDRLGFTIGVSAQAGLAVASATPAGRALAPLVGAVLAAQADGSWARVKACARDSCRWLFYDRTRNHSRTWCTSTTCGSREKARRYYHRHRQRGQPERDDRSA
jgi:predicted RNA-binding Zn ribbon-like protein